MAAIDVRNSIMGLLQTIASKEEQAVYERDVPAANVPAELVCQWFDDLYHPDAELFLEAFSPMERKRLAVFHNVYQARHGQLPDTLAEMHEDAAWLEIMSEVQRLLRDLGWPSSE